MNHQAPACQHIVVKQGHYLHIDHLFTYFTNKYCALICDRHYAKIWGDNIKIQVSSISDLMDDISI